MTNEEVKNLVEEMLKKSGWEITNETTEDGETIVRARG